MQDVLEISKRLKKLAQGNETVTFEGIEPNAYTLEAKVLLKDQKSLDLQRKEIVIKSEEKTRSFKDLFASSPEIVKQWESIKNNPKASLKGKLSIDKGFDNILTVKFKEGGLEQLKKETSLSVYGKYRAELTWIPRFNQEVLSKKTGKLAVLKSLMHIYDAKTTLSNETLLSLAKEFESLNYVEYASLSRNWKNMTPPPLPKSPQAETPDFTEL